MLVIPSLPHVTLRPACPKCSARMVLVRITASEQGFELRSFECPKCEHSQDWVF